MTSEIRRATANDVALFYSESEMPKPSLRALVIEVDGEIKVIGGVSMSVGGPVAFMNMKSDGHRFPKLIMKATKLLVRDVFSLYRCPIYAIRDTSLESSMRFLIKIGFERLNEESEVYIWRPQFHG